MTTDQEMKNQDMDNRKEPCLPSVRPKNALALRPITEIAFQSDNVIEKCAQIGEALHKSGMFGIPNAQAGAVVVMSCFEEGKGLMQFLRENHIVENRPTKKADFLIAEFHRLGGRIKWLETDDKKARATFTWRDEQHTAEFTFDDAVQAGWVTAKDGKTIKHNWRRGAPRRAMLRYRLVTEVFKYFAAEIGYGYDVAELVSDESASSRVTAQEVLGVEEAQQDDAEVIDADVEKVDEAPSPEPKPKPEAAPSKKKRGRPPKSEAAKSQPTEIEEEPQEEQPDDEEEGEKPEKPEPPIMWEDAEEGDHITFQHDGLTLNGDIVAIHTPKRKFHVVVGKESRLVNFDDVEEIRKNLFLTEEAKARIEDAKASMAPKTPERKTNPKMEPEKMEPEPKADDECDDGNDSLWTNQMIAEKIANDKNLTSRQKIERVSKYYGEDVAIDFFKGIEMIPDEDDAGLNDLTDSSCERISKLPALQRYENELRKIVGL